MMVRRGAALAALSLLAASGAAAQPVGKGKITDPRDVIALEAGVWDAVISSPAPSSGRTPATITGVQVNELRSGGLWMLNRMSVNGGAYEGTGIWGYEPTTGRYSGAWADNGNTRIRMDDGSWDPETNTMTWTARVELPDGRVRQLRATSTFVGNTRTYRAFAVTDAGEVPLSIIVFTRRPGPPDR